MSLVKLIAPHKSEFLLSFNAHEIRAVWDLHPNSWSRLNKTIPTRLSVAGEIRRKTLRVSSRLQLHCVNIQQPWRVTELNGYCKAPVAARMVVKVFHLLEEQNTIGKISLSKSLTIGSTINTFNCKLILLSRTTCQSLFIPHLLTLLIPKSQVVSRLRKPQDIKVCWSSIFSEFTTEPHSSNKHRKEFCFRWRNPCAYIIHETSISV